MISPIVYYVLDDSGAPLAVDDVLVWAKWFETADRVLARDDIGAAHVSTVFLGIDHGFGRGAPILWETMIFENGGALDQECWRYASRAEALAGHAAALEQLRAARRARRRD